MSIRPPSEPLTLQRLLRLCKGDLTYEEFASRMPVDPTTGVPSPGPKRLEQIINGELLSFPDIATIRKLAIGCGVTEQTILDACAASVNITITRDSSTLQAILPPGLDELTDQEVAVIRAMLQHWVELHRRANRAERDR
jgi:transcriptional regulator with XRE-family HTH domain